MSIFTRPLNRFTKTTSEGVPPANEQNITYRKKISAVSTSLQGDDDFVAASPRNCYTRSNLVPQRRRIFEEADGAGMSSSGKTPIEQKAFEIRRTQSKKETIERKEENHAPPEISVESPAVDTNAKKKSRPSTSSLASVFRSRTNSPMETVRKVFGRSSSKQSKEISAPPLPPTPTVSLVTQNEQFLKDELEKTRNQLGNLQFQLAEQNSKLNSVQKVSCSQQCDSPIMKTECTMTENQEMTDWNRNENSGKENIHPDVICLEDGEIYSARIHALEREVEALKKENAEQKDDFRKTRKDFILILKEAVLRKDEAEHKLEIISKSVSDEDDWVTLMSQHKHTLRRNVLLAWVQKSLEPYMDQLTVSNFSSDWTDCRAFCALIFDLFPSTMPDVTISPIVGDCVNRCRRAFQLLEIPFDERALGIASTSSPGADSGADEDSSSASSVIAGLADWRYIMNTVFVLYKRGVLGK